MPLKGKLSVGRFELRGIGGFGYAQDIVIITFGGHGCKQLYNGSARLTISVKLCMVVVYVAKTTNTAG